MKISGTVTTASGKTFESTFTLPDDTSANALTSAVHQAMAALLNMGSGGDDTIAGFSAVVER